MDALNGLSVGGNLLLTISAVFAFRNIAFCFVKRLCQPRLDNCCDALHEVASGFLIIRATRQGLLGRRLPVRGIIDAGWLSANLERFASATISAPLALYCSARLISSRSPDRFPKWQTAILGPGTTLFSQLGEPFAAAGNTVHELLGLPTLHFVVYGVRFDGQLQPTLRHILRMRNRPAASADAPRPVAN
jgi:hypothetical protein